ncbi:hypothetical protein D9611_010276 [Ephemerocybe angulata]|uniref:SURP motif domain-containing protein n=1 Tax=Ephemerocybe angulata TaxID=980116 RepID=A0A8H5BBD0_9AGAR|nr:hypothetical protein D9611_010276 [Tulosesus angulatus]
MKRNHQAKRKRQYPSQGYDEGYQRSYEEQVQERQRARAILHIQAHEADIVHGATAKIRAQSLEVDAHGHPGPRTALVKLDMSVGESSSGPSQWNGVDDGMFTLSSASGFTVSKQNVPSEISGKEVWVDRFDARLLLDSLAGLALDEGSNAEPSIEPASPASSTWSDFPEDSRETFFLSQTEIEDYHRIKRRRMMDEAHERRLKEREEEDRKAELDLANVNSDLEPSQEAMLLMQRTANHLLSATNPAQLEMRIMANHGADQRFSFLREGGKWYQSWLEVKANAKAEKVLKEQQESEAKGIGGLAGYGSDSDSDSSEEVVVEEGDAVPEPSEPAPVEPDAPPPPLPQPPEEAPALDAIPNELKEQRRAKAREWMLSRRKEKEQGI